MQDIVTGITTGTAATAAISVSAFIGAVTIIIGGVTTTIAGITTTTIIIITDYRLRNVEGGQHNVGRLFGVEI